MATTYSCMANLSFYDFVHIYQYNLEYCTIRVYHYLYNSDDCQKAIIKLVSYLKGFER